jgi:putative ABC transport system substrate-binding protein
MLAAPRLTVAQNRTVRIGALGPRRNSVVLPHALKRLAELGYVEGKTLILEFRSAEGDSTRFPALARELINAKCDLIFAVGTAHSAQALREAKTTIPIVILGTEFDPVATGIVGSLRRPGGNITGVFSMQPLVSAKRLELLRDMVPAAKRVLVLGDSFTNYELESVLQAARRLGIEPVTETFTSRPYDIDGAFARGRAAGAAAVMVLVSPALFDHRKRIFEITSQYRIPAAVSDLIWGEDGVLFSFGANPAKLYGRGGEIAARILQGAKPADIPIEQPVDFDLVVNLKTAKALGISIPQSVLLRAERVIE